MAEQEFEIQNKRMLIIAGVLGLVTVVLINWHIAQIRKENKANMVSVMVAKTNLKAGDVLTENNTKYVDVDSRGVPEEFRGDLALAGDTNAILNTRLRVDVDKDKFLRWSYITPGRAQSDTAITPNRGFRLVSLPVRGTCPATLRVGQAVDLLTTVPGTGGTRTTVPIIENVLVRSINDVVEAGAGSRNIDTIQVEVPEGDQPFMIAFCGCGFPITVSIRPAGDRPETSWDPKAPRFNKNLIPFMQYEQKHN